MDRETARLLRSVAAPRRKSKASRPRSGSRSESLPACRECEETNSPHALKDNTIVPATGDSNPVEIRILVFSKRRMPWNTIPGKSASPGDQAGAQYFLLVGRA